MTHTPAGSNKVVIIGGGPAGLTAAYELCKLRVESVVLEKDNIVGGIARTVRHKGYHVDIGGHRFFTKIKAVEDMWREVLPNGEFLRRQRLSRIYYNRKFFFYPLRASNALLGLGIWNSGLIFLSYLQAQFFPKKPEETFEEWVTNRFGKRLYNTFFKTYTEKVWGIPCNQIRAEWAAQRIKGLSLLSAIKNAFGWQKTEDKAKVIKTLIDSFDYPECGPGLMWERVAETIQQRGSKLLMDANVDKIYWNHDKVTAVVISRDGQPSFVSGTHFISSMPIRELVQKMSPAVPDEVLAAAQALNYRDFLIVALVVKKRDLFPDNWIYIHDPRVKVGRIQNFKNWSPKMVPDQSKTLLGMEYFCFEGDGLWSMPDEQLIELAKKELKELRLAGEGEVEEGMVIRMPKAYPVYDAGYANALETIRNFLAGISNLQLVGRNGMHKYNNQDHSMYTAMLAVKNIMGANYDLWAVNADSEYHEEVKDTDQALNGELAGLSSTQPKVPLAIRHPDPSLVTARRASQ